MGAGTEAPDRTASSSNPSGRVCRLGRNWAATRGEGYFEVPLDALAADPPDLVLEYAGAVDADPAARAGTWSALPGGALPVRAVAFEGLMIPGPRIVQSARALAAALDEED